eukprot:315174-Pyramimonas_sp.AAC.1
MVYLSRAVKGWEEAMEEKKRFEAKEAHAIKHWGRRMRRMFLYRWQHAAEICREEGASWDIAQDAHERKLRTKGLKAWRHYRQ